MKNKKVVFITRTAVFLALLVAIQALTAPLGNTLVTGSLVNMLLAVCAVTAGLGSSLIVAAVSPVLAKLVGIGPLWEIIIFIMAANAVYVVIWNLVSRIHAKRPIIPLVIAWLSAAVLKFLTLYLTVVQFAVPVWLKLAGKQAAAVSAMFSVPQLITALIGGAVTIALAPLLRKWLRKNEA